MVLSTDETRFVPSAVNNGLPGSLSPKKDLFSPKDCKLAQAAVVSHVHTLAQEEPETLPKGAQEVKGRGCYNHGAWV